MWLEIEGDRVIEGVTEQQLRAAISALRNQGPWSFAILTDEEGNYIQIAGGDAGCTIERRQLKPLYHMRAYREDPGDGHKDGDKLKSGAGDIELKHDEWFTKDEALAVFIAFHERASYPEFVCWRSMNQMFGL